MMATRRLPTDVAPHARQAGDRYEIFQPFFPEYVRAITVTEEFAPHYHRILGDQSAELQRPGAAIHHLLAAGDKCRVPSAE